MGLAIAVVSISGGGIWSFHRFEEKITQNTQENLFAIAKLKANQIEQWISERQADAKIFAFRPSVTTTLQAIESGTKDDNSRWQWQTMQIIAAKMRAEYGYRKIALINRMSRLV